MTGEKCELSAARLREKLTGELIGLARATEGNEYLLTPSTAETVVEGLFLTCGEEDCAALTAMTERVDGEKRKLVPACYSCAASCGRNNAYGLEKLQDLPENIRLLKLRLLTGIRALAADLSGSLPEERDGAVYGFLYKALFAIGMDDWAEDELLPILRELETWQK